LPSISFADDIVKYLLKFALNLLLKYSIPKIACLSNASQLNHQIKSSKNALALESMQNLQVTKQSVDFVQTSVRLDSQSQRAKTKMALAPSLINCIPLIKSLYCRQSLLLTIS
jgi:hypothetical protein